MFVLIMIRGLRALNYVMLAVNAFACYDAVQDNNPGTAIFYGNALGLGIGAEYAWRAAEKERKYLDQFRQEMGLDRIMMP